MSQLTKELVLILATKIAEEHGGKASFYDIELDITTPKEDDMPNSKFLAQMAWRTAENALYELIDEKKLVYDGHRRYSLPKVA